MVQLLYTKHFPKMQTLSNSQQKRLDKINADLRKSRVLELDAIVKRGLQFSTDYGVEFSKVSEIALNEGIERLDEIQEFQETFNLDIDDAIEEIDTYENVCQELRYFDSPVDEIIEAFINLFSINDLCHLEESYRGRWESGGEFTEELVRDCGYIPTSLPTWIDSAIDFQKMWDNALSYDYAEWDNHIFDNF